MIVDGLTQNSYSIFQIYMTDQQNSQTTLTTIASNQQKSEMERWKILQDTQTKCFEIQQDVSVNQAKTEDKMFGKWDEYIRG